MCKQLLNCGWWGSASPFGKRVGKVVLNRPYVLYSLIGDDPIVVQSIIVNGAIIVSGALDVIWTNYLIFSISCYVLGNLKEKEDNYCVGSVTHWLSTSGIFESV